jgi:tetratricopeptide (TPR) repeat protein
MACQGEHTGGGVDNAMHHIDTCANKECTAPGVHRCARCRAVKYCSAACQKVHWKQGGHKQECIPSAEVRASSSAGAGAGHASEEAGACIICLENDPRPIQMGCACRGDAGLAHVKCRAEAAAHTSTRGKIYDGWWQCGTCGQNFTGPMQLGVAEEWWKRTKRLPEEDQDRLVATSNLANALIARGRHAEAETLLRKSCADHRRIFGDDNANTQSVVSNLALALDGQGRHAEAHAIYGEVLASRQRTLGHEHPATLVMAMNMASAIFNQGKFAEAEKLYRDVLEVQRRLLGPQHPSTLFTVANLTNALSEQDKRAEAEPMVRDALAVQRRVLGREHPDTIKTAGDLAAVLLGQGKLVEAEALLIETIEISQRVLGPTHKFTLVAIHNLSRAEHFRGLFTSSMQQRKGGAHEPPLT